MGKTQQNKANEKIALPKYAWVILFVVYLASICAPMNQFKVPPLADVLMAAFSIDLASFGLLMSVFSIMGVILALPAGFIARRLGVKTTTIISLVVLIVGSLLGTFAAELSLMLAARFIEGIGVGLISISAPAALALWFPKQRRGIAMGVWSTWYPLGTVIMLNFAPTLALNMGWTSVWWFGTILTVIALILFVLLFRMPKPGEIVHDDSDHGEIIEKGGFGESFAALKNSRIWILGLSFFMFNFVAIGVINTFYPTYLSEAHGYTMVVASSLVSSFTICSLIAHPIAGQVIDKIGKLRYAMFFGYLGLGVIMTFLFTLSTPVLIIASLVGVGIFAACCSTSTRMGAPELMKSVEEAGMGMAVLSFWQNLGGMVGSAVFGVAVTALGWSGASLAILVPVCAIAAILALFTKLR